MPNNDVVLLNRILDTIRTSAPEGLSDSALFEYFSADQVLKDYDLSQDEILSGITDGNGDGGIDGLYSFANENPIDTDFDFESLPRGYSLDLYIIQAKTTESFEESALDALVVSLPTLLNLAASPDTALYSPILLERLGIFRNALEETAAKFPKVKIHIVYTSRGSTQNIHSRVNAKAEELKRVVLAAISGSEIDVSFVGAKELKEMAAAVPSETFTLEFEGHYSKPGQDSYIALVPLNKYANFLTDGSGRMRRLIFESNVRDYQGTTQVNNAIRGTLAENHSDGDPDFWWLNNGVTMLCTEASIRGNKFTLRDVQIVNGLQTSVAIYEHFKSIDDEEEDRVLLVRIIITSSEDVRNKIILATNRQNPLPPFAMRATDPWQKDIETFFTSKGFFYDRRKNFYKNQGRPATQIVTVPYLAQAVVSIGYGRPNVARARPSTLIATDTEYERIFSNQTQLEGYLWMAKLQKKADGFLRTFDIDTGYKSNMRFLLSMMAAQELNSARVYAPSQLQSQFENEPSDEGLDALAQELKGYFDDYARDHTGLTFDGIAKSQDFVDYINLQRYPE